ncbi:Mannosylfructose-phosphate phosphatase [Hydrogenovibrio crunogenus]|uniref:Mannosylfructose-phosphate phosphatase n=1 Tax=Hydrogenovibrio crunogenus TaxID=39765 RepID=A0A4P7P1D7_9GAMM|nr:HAD-IIB family hydrolase [Hydrogenovibrio crunogenus]QBZ83826.1 Mannosylfructose-phosphate phosphatase [Hydrogenovibrio crunogenus]
MSSRLLLCTDMDRTIIPNGVQKELSTARQDLKTFCDRPEVTLVYVTGRHRALVQEAIEEYQLPYPDYVISDVGTKIYQTQQDEWQVLDQWESVIDQDWHGKTHQDLLETLTLLEGMELQEPSKQNTHKLSYYVSLSTNIDRLLKEADSLLQAQKVDASLIWSIDEAENIGLLDILPKNATKLHAIQFLQRFLNYSLEEVVFAGDSGNDLPVLTSEIHSVLVANASDDIKKQALHLAHANQTTEALYLAQNQSGENGNYAAGVLQGVRHYIPTLQNI